MAAPGRVWDRASGAHLTDGAVGDAEARAEAEAEPGAGHPFAVAGARRYEEVAELGRGGMGTVIAAVDRRLGRQVALKRVAAALGDRGAANQRFAREAWITASLDHPAIVPVYDAGVGDDGELYYTMRLVRGRTLGAALVDADGLAGRLALVRPFLGACEAVAYAHSRGVVHRDLKPDNILIAGFGDTQVVDWGVARRLDEADDRRGPEVAHPTLTRVGAVVGTPAYMSPEQADGAAPDPRADVYGLGVVLFEIVAGRPLRTSAQATTVGVGPRPAPTATMPRDAPPELVAIVERALAIDPAARYPDAAALAVDVAAYLDGRRVAAHRYSAVDELRRWARRRRAPLAVGLVALVFLFAAWAWALVHTRAERDRARVAERTAVAARDAAAENLGRALVEQALTAQASDAQPEAEVLAANALALAESPEARGVLAAFGFAGRPGLRERVELPACDVVEPGPDGALLCVRGGVLTLLVGRPLRPRWTGPRPLRAAIWVADGRWIAAVDGDNHGWLLDPATGAIRTDLGPEMAAATFAHPVVGDLAALVNSAWLTLIDGPGATARKLMVCPDVRGHQTVSVGAGDQVVVTCRDGVVVILDRTGAVRRQLRTALQDKSDLAAAELAPDGRRLVVASMIGQLQTLDVATGAVIADRRTELGVVRKMAFSPDGLSVALVGDRGGVSVWTVATWALRRRLPADHDVAVQWSADGRELVTAGRWLRRWSLALDRPALRLLDPRPPGLAGADLSAAGDRLILAAGDGTLHVLDTRDGRRGLVDRFQNGVVKGVRFLPDGGILAWAAGRPSLRRYDRAGRVIETLDLNGAKRVALLPSGWLVVAPFDLWLQLVDPARGRPRRFGDEQIIDDAQTGDGRRVVALDAAGGLWSVEDGAPPRVHRFAARSGAYTIAVSADGQVLAIAGGGQIELLDPATGVTRARFASGGEHVYDVALSPTGDLIAVGDGDRRARVFSSVDGRLLAVLTGHEARVATVHFTADGAALVTASWDGTARVWGLADLTRPAADVQADVERAWDLTLAAASAAPLR